MDGMNKSVCVHVRVYLYVREFLIVRYIEYVLEMSMKQKTQQPKRQWEHTKKKRTQQ